jgi:tetratricopeptide (TPR) repeat protein
MKLEHIEALKKEKRYAEALIACDDMAVNNPELIHEARRQKSYIFSRQAQYSAAVHELSSIIETGGATIGDYDSAAFWALYDGQFKQALDWYLIALKMGKEQNEAWFRSNEVFLIAYIYMELGEQEKALAFLEKGEAESADGGPFLIPNKGFCEIQQLREEIQRRTSI